MKEPLEPTQQELVVKASQETVFSKEQSMLVSSPERDRCAMLMEEALRRTANNLQDQDPLKDPRQNETSLDEPKLVPFYSFSSQRIKVSFA